MDVPIIAGVTMLVSWAWMTFTTAAPGWVHILLTMGLFLVIWRIVVRGTTPQTPQHGSREQQEHRD